MLRKLVYTVAAYAAVFVTLGAGGCAEDAAETSPDGEFDAALVAGKADHLGFSACQLDAVVLLLNDASESVDSLKVLGVHTRAARNLMAWRAGDDEKAGTEDDRYFPDLDAVDGVSWVGPAAMRQLGDAVKRPCEGVATRSAVIMSPQEFDASHVARAEQLIDAAQRSIDVAMYSFRLTSLREALGRAQARGVDVRLLFETANADRKQADGGGSAKFEDLGIDVRYINKIMHHKFMLVDGPQNHLTEAVASTLFTGSGNWSSSAATRYDENTLELSGVPELALRFQREFDHLWANSRDFVWNDQLTFTQTTPIPAAAIPDHATMDAAFTSDNFKTSISNTYGPTFSTIAGLNTVADRIVTLIDSAERSIRIASGHLRSRQISEALLRRLRDTPDLKVQIYLDGQEFISASSQQRQEDELDACLIAAGDSDSKRQRCMDRGYYFSYELHLAGAEVRFKHYAYRWHYSYAPQMHHKYFVVDDTQVASGSYNLSDNAEHNTMENVVFVDGAQFPDVAKAFRDNFDALWVTGEADGLYDALVEEISDGKGDIPIVYASMALPWPQVDALKRLIREMCPQILDEEFRRYPERHYVCPRS